MWNDLWPEALLRFSAIGWRVVREFARFRSAWFVNVFDDDSLGSCFWALSISASQSTSFPWPMSLGWKGNYNQHR